MSFIKKAKIIREPNRKNTIKYVPTEIKFNCLMNNFIFLL